MAFQPPPPYKGQSNFFERNMEPPTSPASSLLSSALADPIAYFNDLQTARDLIATYNPSSPHDFTLSLLSAILDSESIIGHWHSGMKNVLDDIVRENHHLAALAEHYMTAIYFPRILPPHHYRNYYD